jgi:hypothetical protein
LPCSLWIGGGAMPACYEIGGYENQRKKETSGGMRAFGPLDGGGKGR